MTAIRRRRVLALLLIPVLLLPLVGCGGGAGTSGGTELETTSLPGHVELPAECPVAPEETQVFTTFTPECPVTEQGTFSAEVAAGGAQIVALLGPGDQPLGLTLATGVTSSTSQMTAANGDLVISPRTTAITWVFLTPFIVNPDPDGAQMVLEFLDGLPEIDTLAAAIEQALAAGNDITDPDNAEIANALGAATDAALAAALQEVESASAQGIEVDPTETQDGINVSVESSSPLSSVALLVKNYAMRYMHLYAIPEDLDGNLQTDDQIGPILIYRAQSLLSSLFGNLQLAAPSEKPVQLDMSTSSAYTLHFYGPGEGWTSYEQAGDPFSLTIIRNLVCPFVEVLTGLPIGLVVDLLISICVEVAEWQELEQALTSDDWIRVTTLVFTIAFQALKANGWYLLRELAQQAGKSISEAVVTVLGAVARIVTIVNAAYENIRFLWEYYRYGYAALVVFRVYGTGGSDIIISAIRPRAIAMYSP